MREISFDEKPSSLPIYTVINYGDTRSGKTTWAATWPRPLILADSIEGGYQSVQAMTREQLFEPDRTPIIWAIENPNDMSVAMERAAPLIAKGDVRTIVVDAFSFYVEFYLAHLIKLQSAGGKSDNRAVYGDLGKHLRAVRGMVHLMGCNVVWNCLVSHPSEEDPKGRPLIPGKQGQAFPAAVSFLLHSELVQKREAGKIVDEQFVLRTKQHGPYIAGTRLGAKASDLPDPFVGDYAAFMEALGHDVEQIRRLIKANTPLPGAKVTPVAATAKPAVQPTKGPTVTVRPGPAAPKPPVAVRR